MSNPMAVLDNIATDFARTPPVIQRLVSNLVQRATVAEEELAHLRTTPADAGEREKTLRATLEAIAHRCVKRLEGGRILLNDTQRGDADAMWAILDFCSKALGVSFEMKT